ncbi:MAG: CoA transferase subunit A [Eubacteriales bacterium]|nr:CoA transferase subunit A [Eubacteriales bacterium]
MDKIISYDQAMTFIKNGSRIMLSGFGDIGVALGFVKRILSSDLHDLTIIDNDGGYPDEPKGQLIISGKVSKLITTFIGLNPEASKLYHAGELNIEFIPQGTFVEAVRAAGYGLGGVLTKTGLGTMLGEGRQTVNIDGDYYLIEKPIKGDIALIRAKQSDKFGNLIFDYCERNYAPYMAMAADLVIAEVKEIVNPEEWDPNNIMVPGIFIDYIVVEQNKK